MARTDTWGLREGAEFLRRIAGPALVLAALPATLLSAVSGAAAQGQLVLPAPLAARSGPSQTNLPFGRSTPTRMQIGYDGLGFPPGSGLYRISEISLRLQEGTATAGKRVDLEIQMSTVGFGIENLQSEFAQNRGGDLTTVFTRKLVDLAPVASGAPGNWLGPIPLDVPFVYGPRPGNVLVVEFVVHGQPPGSVVLDMAGACDSTFVDFGLPACGPAAGQTALPVLEGSTRQIVWGRDATFRILNARADFQTLLMFGIESGTVAGLSVPIDLGPFRAPGCALNVVPFLWFNRIADPTGVAVYTFPVPSVPTLQGSPLWLQGLALDPGANPLGLVTTRGLRTGICGFEPVGRVFAGGLTATTGLREVGFAPIVRFGLQ